MQIPFVKPIAVFGILQFIVCILGFLAVATLMKIGGYPDQVANPWRLTWWLLFVREWWFVILMIPAAWTLWASYDSEFGKSPLTLDVHILLGVVGLGGIIFFFCGATLQASRLGW